MTVNTFAIRKKIATQLITVINNSNFIKDGITLTINSKSDFTNCLCLLQLITTLNAFGNLDLPNALLANLNGSLACYIKYIYGDDSAPEVYQLNELNCKPFNELKFSLQKSNELLYLQLIGNEIGFIWIEFNGLITPLLFNLRNIARANVLDTQFYFEIILPPNSVPNSLFARGTKASSKYDVDLYLSSCSFLYFDLLTPTMSEVFITFTLYDSSHFNTLVSQIQGLKRHTPSQFLKPSSQYVGHKSIDGGVDSSNIGNNISKCSTSEKSPTIASDHDQTKDPRTENFKQIEDSLKDIAKDTANDLDIDQSREIVDEDTLVTSSFEVPTQVSGEKQQPYNSVLEMEVTKLRNPFADEADFNTEFETELRKSKTDFPEKTYSKKKFQISKTIWDVSSSEPSTPVRIREYENEKQTKLVTIKLKPRNNNEVNADGEDGTITWDDLSYLGNADVISTVPNSNSIAMVDNSEPMIKRRRKDGIIVQTQFEEVDGVYNRTRLRTKNTAFQNSQSVVILPSVSKHMSTSTPMQSKKNPYQKLAIQSRPITSQSRKRLTSVSDLSLQQNQGSADTTFNDEIEIDFGSEIRYTQLEESFNKAASQVSQLLVQKLKNLEKDIVSKQIELEEALHARYNQTVEKMKTEFKLLTNTHESNLQKLQEYYHDRIQKLTNVL